MGTFVGHFVPGFALALLGLWHTINTARSFFLRGQDSFKSRFWYPFDLSLFGFKHLELILVLSFSILAIITQVLDFPLFQFSFKLDNFEHATMFLHLLVFAGFSLFAEITRTSEILSGVTGILATSLLGQELFLLHFHSTDHIGIEGHYHWLLQLIVSVSLLAALAVTCCPTNFPAALVLAISVAFQGLWFINMGFMLWVPEFVPKGCNIHLGGGAGGHGVAVVCGSHEADSRARALANLQFSWILSTVLVFISSLCLNLSQKCASRARSAEYQQLQSRVGELSVSVDGFKHAFSLGM